MILQGSKVKLRAVEREDILLLKELLNDPRVEHNVVGYAPPISTAREEMWYEKHIYEDDPIRWIIETEKDGAVGTVILGGFDWKNRVAHITGIKLLDHKVTEPGIAIDAMKTVLDYGFYELNLNRIEGGYIEYNKGSEILNKITGFKIEGVHREAVYKNGEYHNVVFTAVLKSDYK